MLTINNTEVTVNQIAKMLNTCARIAAAPAEVKTIATAEFDRVFAKFQISSEGFLMVTVGTAKDSIVLMFDADNFTAECLLTVVKALSSAASR